VYPAYYAGALYGACETDVVNGVPTTVCNGPSVAPANAPGPYDQMRVLKRPWDTTWEDDSER